MTAVINKLKDKTGDQQLPVTHERAVRDSNGTTLESKIQNLEGAMDKAYVAQSDNGMGRITLKKNIVSGVNTLTQAMMQATNTIYVIQYDFTLGEDITIPANCVLEFEGGSISGNGTGKDTITCNNTYIKGHSPKSNFSIDGTFDYDTIDSFGVSPNNTAADNTLHFESFNTFNVSCIKFGAGTYNFSSTINIKKNVSILGESQNSTKLIFPTDAIIFGANTLTWYNNVVVKDIYIKAENGNCFDLANNMNVSVNNATFRDISLEAPNGACFYQTYRLQKAYTNHFVKVTFINSRYAFNHCSLILSTVVEDCIDLGVFIYFNNINAEGEGLICRNLAVGCNHTMKHFICCEGPTDPSDSAASKISVYNCSFEELTSNFVFGTITQINITYFIYFESCTFNAKTFAPNTNYIYDNGFKEVNYDNADNFYPFVGCSIIPSIKNCSFLFYNNERTHKIYACIGEGPYYWNYKVNMAILMLYYGAQHLSADLKFIDVSTLGNRTLNVAELGYINADRTSIIINKNSINKTLYIIRLGINLRKEDYVKVLIVDHSVKDIMISTTSDFGLISDNNPSVGTKIFYRDTGILKTWNGSAWVDATGTPV